MEKTWVPVTGGILSIICGAANIACATIFFNTLVSDKINDAIKFSVPSFDDIQVNSDLPVA